MDCQIFLLVYLLYEYPHGSVNAKIAPTIFEKISSSSQILLVNFFNTLNPLNKKSYGFFVLWCSRFAAEQFFF